MNEQMNAPRPPYSPVTESEQKHLVQVVLTEASYSLAIKAAEIFGREVVEIVLSGAFQHDFEGYDYNDALEEVLQHGVMQSWACFDSYSKARELAERFKKAQPFRQVAIAPVGGGYAVDFVMGASEQYMMIGDEGARVPEMSEIL
jgi:hypothetical protein